MDQFTEPAGGQIDLTQQLSQDLVMQSLDPVFSALADPTRRAILARLAQGDANVGSLSEPFSISPPAISRHLRLLEEAGLISNERHGKERICRLNHKTLARALDWLDFNRRFWSGSFDRLEKHLSNSTGGKRQ